MRGGAAFAGSPAFLDAQFPAFPAEFFRKQKQDQAKQQRAIEQGIKRRNDILSNALIGGAFPALFGQGLGASLGGAAGGAAGGALGGQFGFGLSLIGTALGASFDALIARSKELAEALRDPITSFDQLKVASVLSSRGLETYIEALIKTGQTAKAEQLIRADLTQNVNPTTAAALSQANDELARSFSDVQEKLSGLVAGPAIAFLKWLDEIIDRLPIRGPGGADVGQLPSPAAARATAQAGREKQGIGLGLAGASLGTIIGATILSATGAGAPAGAALFAYGLLGTGAAGVTLGKAQESQGTQAETDIETQNRTAAVQKDIEAIQQRRVALQKQLVGFAGNESSAFAQIAQGQNIVLTAQEAILQARKTFLSLPLDASPKESADAYAAYKDAIAAARVEVEKLIASNNKQARSLKRTTDVRERTTGFTASARQGAVLADVVAKAREEYDKAKAATASATGDDAIAAAQSIENKLGQAWRSAKQDLADYNAELSLTAQRQATVNARNLEQIRTRIKDAQALSKLTSGPERDAFRGAADIRAGIEAARAAEQDLIDQINIAIQRGDTQEVTNLIGQQKVAAEDVRLKLIQGADTLRQRLREGSDQIRGTLEGSFNLLRSGEQQRLLNQARSEINTGIFDPSKIRTPQDVFSAASASKQLDSLYAAQAANQKELITNNTQLNQLNASINALNNNMTALTGKDWTVNTYVNAGTDAQSRADILAAATLP